MRTNTGAALRVVEEIDDPQEIAQREADQVTVEKAEIVEKLQDLRAVKAEVDAIVASGDHRKINDDLLERGAKCERGLAAMEKALAIAEARRIEAEERVSAIARERAAKAAAATVAEDDEKLVVAQAAVEEAAESFLKAIHARVLVIEAAMQHNAAASGYGLPSRPQAETTREVLARVTQRTGVRIEVGPPGVIFVKA